MNVKVQNIWDCKPISICNQYVVSTCLTWALMILMWGCRPSLPFAAERSGADSAGHLWSGGAEARNLCIPGRLPWKIWENLLRNARWLQLTSETSTWHDKPKQVKHSPSLRDKLCKHPLKFYTFQLVFETWQLAPGVLMRPVVACSWTKADDGEKETERPKLLSQGLAQFAVDNICYMSPMDPHGASQFWTVGIFPCI